jgi:succinyl-diaminopimelate desuccinylase
VLDCRLVPGQDPAALALDLELLLATACDAPHLQEDPTSRRYPPPDRARYDFRVVEVRHPTATPAGAPVVQALASAYTALTGQEPTYGGVPGSTDGTILHAAKGIPIVTCGPGDIHIPHHIDEWVSIEEIKLAARLYALAAVRFLGEAG